MRGGAGQEAGQLPGCAGDAVGQLTVPGAPVLGSPLPSGTCSCANAPMGVIAAAPRPTFNNPFNANLAMQAPAVPPGFMTYAQATGAPAYSNSSGGAVVLRAPSGGNAPQMAAMLKPSEGMKTREIRGGTGPQHVAKALTEARARLDQLLL